MMHRISVKQLCNIVLLAALLGGCGKKEQPATPHDSTASLPPADGTATDETAAAPYVFFNVDSLSAIIDAGKHKLDQDLETDPAKVKGYLSTLSGSDPASIPYAIHYIKYHPAPAGSPVYDTLYKQFRSLYYLVAVAYSDVVAGPTCSPVLDKKFDNPQDPALKNLLAYLGLYSLKVYASEGTYYTDADPELYYNIFRTKASPSLLYYLNLQSKDLKDGFSEDGGLVITYPQLYERIEAWGLFIAAHPNHFLRKEALGDYRMYLSALLTGMDNTPVFDYEKHTLDPEIKTLYETIMETGKDGVSKKIITDYYNFLSKNDFKESDAVNTFLDQYDLSSQFTQPV